MCIENESVVCYANTEEWELRKIEREGERERDNEREQQRRRTPSHMHMHIAHWFENIWFVRVRAAKKASAHRIVCGAYWEYDELKLLFCVYSSNLLQCIAAVAGALSLSLSICFSMHFPSDFLEIIMPLPLSPKAFGPISIVCVWHQKWNKQGSVWLCVVYTKANGTFTFPRV